MKVKELIAELQQYDPELVVTCYRGDESTGPVAWTDLSTNEFFDGKTLGSISTEPHVDIG